MFSTLFGWQTLLCSTVFFFLFLLQSFWWYTTSLMSAPTAHVRECLPMFRKNTARQVVFSQFAATLYTKSDDIN